MGTKDPLRKTRLGHCPGLAAISHGEFLQDVRDMTRGSAAADGQRVGNLLVGLPECKQGQDFALPSREAGPSVLGRHGAHPPFSSGLSDAVSVVLFISPDEEAQKVSQGARCEEAETLPELTGPSDRPDWLAWSRCGTYSGRCTSMVNSDCCPGQKSTGVAT
jgi:hypothetical protein